jgi:hypothetical protein
MRVCYHSYRKQKKEKIGWSRGCLDQKYMANEGYLDGVGVDADSIKRNLKKYSLEFEYTFEYENDQVSFAYCFPYTYEDLQKDSQR